MRILIIAFRFPPSNLIGAIRVGKLARYLNGAHDVRVLTTDLHDDRSLPVELPSDRIVYTDFQFGFGPFDRLSNRLRRWITVRKTTFPEGAMISRSENDPAKGFDKWLWTRLRRQYYALVHLPDLRIGWLKTALPEGRMLIKCWRPDIIFASGPPFSGFIVASRLAREFTIPWVADFRDLWVDNPYYDEPFWRRPIETILEHTTIKSAAALITVSPTWADQLRKRHKKRTITVFNGYAAEDFPSFSDDHESGPLTLRYTGTVYPGFRDPSPLFAALGSLENSVRDNITVEFYGDIGDEVQQLAAKYGAADRVLIKHRVPYREALRLQASADVLVLMQWNDVHDEGNLPAKLFEYLYSRKPILFLGYETGIAAQMVRERRAGFVSNAPEAIGHQLRSWVEEKKAGRLTRLDPAVSRGLSRDEQFEKLERLCALLLSAVPGRAEQSLLDVSDKHELIC